MQFIYMLKLSKKQLIILENIGILNIIYNLLKLINYFPDDDYYKDLKKIKGINECKKINLYTLSSFTYLFLGITMYFNNIKSNYYNNFAYISIIIQSYITYLSDCKYVNVNHWSHNIDYTLAIYNSINFFNIISKYKIKKLDILIILSSYISKLLGSYYLKKKNINNYMKYHIYWHFSIPLLSIYKILKK